MKISKFLAATCLLALAAGSAQALTWNWSFAGEAGTFETDGASYGAGTFNVTDFTVTSSGMGATIGSWTGGEYAAAGYVTSAPYSFDWDGSAITALYKSGSNTFSWFVFEDLGTSDFYFFGWEQNNINTLNHATYYDPSLSFGQPSYVYTLTPGSTTPVPVPASALLMLPVVAGFAGLRRLQKNAS